ncbi:hypothetical protein BC830DRAFT_1051749, partial [Chytriomyces sp. MP71]
KRVAALSDDSIKDEVGLIHQSSVRAFARAVAKVRRPQPSTTHILQDGIVEDSPYSKTINFLKGIGERAVEALNSHVPLSPFPYDINYDINSQMDLDSRIKVLT